MGCWNKTCGLSNLHIRAGEQVYVFPIVSNGNASDRCYSTAFWSPVMIPFLSEYNDYGGGENSHKNIEYTLKGLREHMVEMELGENQYHDIEVKKDKMDEELFFEAVHESRLFVGDRAFGGQRMVDFVMIKASVVDHICENLVLEQYVGDGKGTHGYGNNYINYNWDTIVADSHEVLDRICGILTGETDDPEIKELTDGLPPKLMLKYGLRNLDTLFDYRHPNKAAAYLRGIEDYRMSRLVRPMEEIGNLITEGKKEEAHALLIDVLRAAFINSFMECSRRNWMPMGHEGSQGQEHAQYRVLCSAITAELDKEVAEQAEWDAEDEE